MIRVPFPPTHQVRARCRSGRPAGCAERVRRRLDWGNQARQRSSPTGVGRTWRCQCNLGRRNPTVWQFSLQYPMRHQGRAMIGARGSRFPWSDVMRFKRPCLMQAPARQQPLVHFPHAHRLACLQFGAFVAHFQNHCIGFSTIEA